MSGDWVLLERSGDVARLVGELPDVDDVTLSGRRIVCPTRPTDRAIVLGSSQDAALVDAVRASGAGSAVVRRRSGGGAVYVEPGAQVWIDVFVPAGDPLLVADVGRSAWWLGELWADACAHVTGAGRGAYTVHRGGLVASPWSRVACFAGLGPGEVTVGGRKLVGISQRRDRRGAWLHSMALARLDADGFARQLALAPDDRAGLAGALASGVATLHADAPRPPASPGATAGIAPLPGSRTSPGAAGSEAALLGRVVEAFVARLP